MQLEGKFVSCLKDIDNRQKKSKNKSEKRRGIKQILKNVCHISCRNTNKNNPVLTTYTGRVIVNSQNNNKELQNKNKKGLIKNGRNGRREY